jgi:hypothetical protein
MSMSAVVDAPTAQLNGNGAPAQLPSSMEVQRQWQSFIDYCGDKKFLAMALGAAQPPEVYGNTLRLYIANDTDMTLINRSREVLVEKLQSFFKAPLTIESVIGQNPRPTVAEPSQGRNGTAPRVDHPFLKGLIELLDANPI